MSCTDALQEHIDEGPPKPERDDIPAEAMDTIEFQLGYKLGWHHGLEDAVEISEEEAEE